MSKPGLLTADTKVIVTKAGAAILVDAADFDALSVHAWRAERTGRKFYAIADIDGATVYMHRVLLGLPVGDPRMGDHGNGCTLDNRRANLKIATAVQNAWSGVRARRNRTGFSGVTLVRATGRYQARIYIDGRRRSLGYFPTAQEAASAYEARAAAVQAAILGAAQ